MNWKTLLAAGAIIFTSTTFAQPLVVSSTIVSWGLDRYNEVTDTPTGNNFVQVTGGVAHSLALKDDGSIVGWGLDTLVNGTPTGQVSNTPTGNDFVQVAATFYSSFALKADGSIVSWGADRYNQVSDTPSGNDFVQVAGASAHALALKSDGSIVSWGSDSFGSVTNTPTGTGFVQVAGGGSHSLALKVDGSIVSWGYNLYNQVTDTPAGNDYVQVAGGLYHSLALKADGSVVSWGRNEFNQVTDTPTGNDYVQLAAKGSHSVALKSDGSIVSWGRNEYNQVTDTPSGTGFIQVDGGGFHSLALIYLSNETPLGAPVVVQPPLVDEYGDPINYVPAITLTFDSVSAAGDTTVIITENGPAPPGGFELVGIDGGTTYIDIETTAIFDDFVEVCIDYSGFSLLIDPANLKLAHIVDGEWVDITFSNVNSVICGSTPSFSFFAIVQVPDPIVLLSDLYSAVDGLDATEEIKASLISKLAKVERLLEDGNVTDAASDLVRKFISKVQKYSSKHISVAEADDLVRRATELTTVLLF